jgi:hypothetical protein
MFLLTKKGHWRSSRRDGQLIKSTCVPPPSSFPSPGRYIDRCRHSSNAGYYWICQCSTLMEK